ncbi:MAG TPA: NAD(P)-binding domain-containing protein, partial [Pseudonocardiaceae bacterium]
MTPSPVRVGWIGIGRMGAALVHRLLEAGHDVAVYNRTRSKTDAVARRGAKVVDAPVDLAEYDVVFTMVSDSADLTQVTSGEGG